METNTPSQPDSAGFGDKEPRVNSQGQILLASLIGFNRRPERKLCTVECSDCRSIYVYALSHFDHAKCRRCEQDERLSNIRPDGDRGKVPERLRFPLTAQLFKALIALSVRAGPMRDAAVDLVQFFRTRSISDFRYFSPPLSARLFKHGAAEAEGRLLWDPADSDENEDEPSAHVPLPHHLLQASQCADVLDAFHLEHRRWREAIREVRQAADRAALELDGAGSTPIDQRPTTRLLIAVAKVAGAIAYDPDIQHSPDYPPIDEDWGDRLEESWKELSPWIGICRQAAYMEVSEEKAPSDAEVVPEPPKETPAPPEGDQPPPVPQQVEVPSCPSPPPVPQQLEVPSSPSPPPVPQQLEVPSSPSPPPPITNRRVLKRDKGQWLLQFGTEETTFDRQLKTLERLQRLVQSPRQWIDCADLCGKRKVGLPLDHRDAPDPVMTRSDLEDVVQKIRTLRQRIAEEDYKDFAERDQMQEQMEKLQEFVDSATSPQGRVKSIDRSAESDPVNLRSGLERLYAKLVERSMVQMVDHLKSSIKVEGRQAAYLPPSDDRSPWELF